MVPKSVVHFQTSWCYHGVRQGCASVPWSMGCEEDLCMFSFMFCVGWYCWSQPTRRTQSCQLQGTLLSYFLMFLYLLILFGEGYPATHCDLKLVCCCWWCACQKNYIGVSPESLTGKNDINWFVLVDVLPLCVHNRDVVLDWWHVVGDWRIDQLLVKHGFEVSVCIFWLPGVQRCGSAEAHSFSFPLKLMGTVLGIYNGTGVAI